MTEMHAETTNCDSSGIDACLRGTAVGSPLVLHVKADATMLQDIL